MPESGRSSGIGAIHKTGRGPPRKPVVVALPLRRHATGANFDDGDAKLRTARGACTDPRTPTRKLIRVRATQQTTLREVCPAALEVSDDLHAATTLAGKSPPGDAGRACCASAADARVFHHRAVPPSASSSSRAGRLPKSTPKRLLHTRPLLPQLGLLSAARSARAGTTRLLHHHQSRRSYADLSPITSGEKCAARRIATGTLLKPSIGIQRPVVLFVSASSTPRTLRAISTTRRPSPRETALSAPSTGISAATPLQHTHCVGRPPHQVDCFETYD